MYVGLRVKHVLFLSDLNETLIFLTDFQKILKYQIQWKFVQCVALFHVDWQTDRHDKAKSHVNFANTPKNSWYYSTTLLKHITFFHSFTIINFLFCVFVGYKIIHYLVKRLGFQQNIYQLQTSLGKTKFCTLVIKQPFICSLFLNVYLHNVSSFSAVFSHFWHI